MDITNIENEWKDLKNNKKRNTDLNNILKDLDSAPGSSAREGAAKQEVKHIVKAFLEEDEKKKISAKTQKSNFKFD